MFHMKEGCFRLESQCYYNPIVSSFNVNFLVKLCVCLKKEKGLQLIEGSLQLLNNYKVTNLSDKLVLALSKGCCSPSPLSG